MSITTADTNSATTELETGLRPRRTINRLVLAFVGVGLAALGQLSFGRSSLWDGLFFYFIGTLLFVRALIPTLGADNQLSIPNPQQEGTLLTRSGWQRVSGVCLMIMALVISLLGYNFFGQNDAQSQAWGLYWGSIVFFIIGVLFLTPALPLKTEWRRYFPNPNILLALGLILILATFMRLYNFTSLPFGLWFDEAQAGLQARAMLQNPEYRPLFFSPINVTGHLLGLYALALHWWGDTIHSLRLVSVLFGLAGVLTAYLFGQELRSPRFGLALAFLLAVARWHVNFSRIAMTGVDTPFFEFLSLFFLTRLLKRGLMRDALGAGLSLGLGLMFYTAFRLFVLAIGIFLIVLVIYWWKPVMAALSQKGWQRYLLAGVILLLSGWLIVMPLFHFAINNRKDFLYRTNQISIFTKRDQPDIGKALWRSTRLHLLMFNYQGDRNGRHNLPSEPMLDPLTGILAVLGLGLALTRVRQPANTFFIILLPTALIGGIFSVDFEAPQSLRSIAVIPVVIYMAALSLSTLGREAERALKPLPKALIIVPATLLGAYIFLFNAYTYFERQANDFASWNAFSAPETMTGRKMAELGPDYVYILSPFLTNHPTTRFLAPDIIHQQHLQIPDALPIRDPSNRPVALFIHPDESWVYEQAKRFYPHATYNIFTGPSSSGSSDDGPPSVYFVNLPTPELNAIRGLDLRYWSAAQLDEVQQAITPPYTSRVFALNATWPQDSPLQGDFVAEWNGTLYAPHYGPYKLRLLTPGPALVEIDGQVILEGQGEQSIELPLAMGNHRLRVRAESAEGQVGLYWQPPKQTTAELIPAWALYSTPVTNHGLLGSFYANNNWEGQPALQRLDPFLDNYFHLIPLKRPYTVEWAGVLVAPQSGVYRLGLRVVQEAELYLDGRRLIVTRTPNQYTEAPLNLEAGLHDIRIRYRDNVDRSRVHLTWMTPTGVLEAIPSEFLWPPMGDYPAPLAAAPQDPLDIRSVSLNYIASLGLAGNETGQFVEPRDVVLMSNGNIVVADTGNKRVQVFDSQYNHLYTLNGAADLPFEEPLAVGVNNQDQILVLDSTLQWIYHYDANGNFINRFGGPDARLFHPRGLTLFANDTLAIADTGTARLAFYSLDGTPIGSIGGIGEGPGQLNEPTDVLRDSQGNYIVVEAENNRIQRLDAGGTPINQWAIPPTYAYDGPHLALVPDGSILMTESQSKALLRYSPSGILLDQWNILDPIKLQIPVGIYLDPNTQRLYITDVASHQIHIFELQTGN